jgi:hypothetical protein
MDYAFSLFQPNAPLFGRNTTPGLTEQQAVTLLSNLKVIMTEFTGNHFEYHATMYKDLIGKAKKFEPIRIKHKLTFDMATSGPTPYVLGEKQNESTDKLDKWYTEQQLINVPVWQQIQNMGDNNTMDIGLLRDKVYLLLKFHTAGREESMNWDLRMGSGQVILQDANNMRTTCFQEATKCTLRIHDGKTGHREVTIERIRAEQLQTNNANSPHLNDIDEIRKLDVFEATYVYLRRTDEYYQQFPPSEYSSTAAKSKIHTPWFDTNEMKKFYDKAPFTAKIVKPSTLTKRLKKLYARSGWTVSHRESDTQTDAAQAIGGIKTIAGHISRSHVTSIWNHFGMFSAQFASDIAQERAGHTKQTFDKCYSREIPQDIKERWTTHANNIFLSADEIIFL